MLVIEDASKVLRTKNEREVFVDKDYSGDLEKNCKLLNTRKLISY